jgi:hypothetical protein
MMIRAVGTALLGAMLIACGSNGADDDEDDDDSDDDGGAAVVGMYQTSRHAVAQAIVASEPIGCDSAGDERADPAFFAVVVSDFGDLEVQTCTDADLASCTPTTIGFEADDLSSESSNTQTGGGSDCTLYHFETVAIPDGDGLRIEEREWIVYPDPPGDCALESAEALGSSDDCYRVEVFEGTRVAEPSAAAAR